MKLRFERFEGLAVFSVRGELSPSDMRILEVGLESLMKDLSFPLVLNLSLAKIQTIVIPTLQGIKKALPSQTDKKIHWISEVKNLGDYPALQAFVSRQNGSKLRQIGERLILEDQIYAFEEKSHLIQEKLSKLSGDEGEAHALIFQNQLLSAQERILKETVHFQKERMKLQVVTPESRPEIKTETTELKLELNKAYGMDLNL